MEGRRRRRRRRRRRGCNCALYLQGSGPDGQVRRRRRQLQATTVHRVPAAGAVLSARHAGTQPETGEQSGRQNEIKNTGRNISKSSQGRRHFVSSFNSAAVGLSLSLSFLAPTNRDFNVASREAPGSALIQSYCGRARLAATTAGQRSVSHPGKSH